MRYFLITGGAGFVASNLAKALIQNDENYVVIVDNLLTGSLDNLPSQNLSNWKFIKADANNTLDLSQIMTSHSFDYVFHYAAVVGVKRTLENPVMVLEDIAGISEILRLSKNTGVRRFFFSSSSEVYGEPVELPQHETRTPLNSKLPYAIVKNVGEAFCKSYAQEYGLDFTIFRFFNTYGNRQSADFVITKFLKCAVNNEDITIYGDGSQTRTFCHISDNIDCTIKILDNELCINETVNIGNDVETTILELAKLVIQLTNSSSKIVHLPPLEEGDMTRRQPDITKMRSVLQRELTPLEDGLEGIINSLSKSA